MSDWNASPDPHRPPSGPPAPGWSGGSSWSPGGPPGQPTGYPQPGDRPGTGSYGQPGDRPGTGGYGQAPGPGPAAPRTTGRRSTGPLLLGAVLGLAVAVVVGAVLVVTKVMHFGAAATATAAADTRPLTLPDSLAGLADYTSAVQAKASAGNGKPAAVLATNQHMVALTEAAYQKAFGGAATTVRSYASADLMGIYTVIAVRASAPGLVNGPVNDPADLGLARNNQTIQTIGDQQCTVVSTEVVVSGKTVDENQLLTAACERTGDGLTVWAFGGGVDGPQGQTQITGLVDGAYTALSAGR